MKLTPIYPAHIKPVHPGVYKVTLTTNGKLDYWAYWTGALWGYAYWFHENAHKNKGKHKHVASQNKRWQGLTTKDGK